MKRHFLTLGWTSLLDSPPAVLICGLFTAIAAAHAQIRTVTQQPYPTGGNSVAWITNVPYVDGGGPQQQLDLYIPTNQKNMPLVVFVHGGGWEHGDKAGDSLNPNNLQLLWDGYAMASVNYRLAPAAIWPAQIQDCKAAIRWLKAHANEYGYDASRIAVMGESAGGQLVAMLGTTSGSKTFDVGENLDSSSDVSCVVDLFGPSDFTVFDGKFSFIGGAPKDHVDLARSASPINYVHVDEPPMLVVHGTADQLVPYLQAELLVEAMDKTGAPYYFHSVIGGGHNPYFGLKFDASGSSFNSGGGGIGLFEDPMVEPLIKAFLHHYLLDRRKDLFTGVDVTKSEATPTLTLGDKITRVLPDRHVTFRLLAPEANAVEVVVGIKSGPYEPQGSTTAKMMKDANGLWSVTLGPLEPNLYEYQFSLDGRKITDPGNDMPKPQRQVDTSLLLIPGTPPDFLDVQNGAHGTMRDETYYSTTLGKNRRVLVYTPPSYDRSHAALPVLYLYHGFWDTRYSWVTEGRLAQILDNLLAEGKAVPMIVVVPEAHALPPEDIPGTDNTPYLAKNQQAVDEELFHDIIPFIETHYNISDEPRKRAIAGLSMGGLQAIETGIVHLGYFRWIGART